jgi:hypothetical protein
MEQNGRVTRLAGALGSAVVHSRPMAVGFGLIGLEIRLDDGRHLAVKARASGQGRASDLSLEGYMLGELARHSEFPVPRVHHAEPGLLAMDHRDGRQRDHAKRRTSCGRADRKAERDPARRVRL